jgi:hypothetical protein
LGYKCGKVSRHLDGRFSFVARGPAQALANLELLFEAAQKKVSGPD